MLPAGIFHLLKTGQQKWQSCFLSSRPGMSNIRPVGWMQPTPTLYLPPPLWLGFPRTTILAALLKSYSSPESALLKRWPYNPISWRCQDVCIFCPFHYEPKKSPIRSDQRSLPPTPTPQLPYCWELLTSSNLRPSSEHLLDVLQWLVIL